MLPMTGSAENTSIVGNVLDRGSVFFNHRYDFLTGLEVLLGNGKVVKTGFWHYFDSNKQKDQYFSMLLVSVPISMVYSHNRI
jgi:4-cresol dehydrogenase (hydroxylating)